MTYEISNEDHQQDLIFEDLTSETVQKKDLLRARERKRFSCYNNMFIEQDIEFEIKSKTALYMLFLLPFIFAAIIVTVIMRGWK